MSIFGELKRRNVFRVGIAYVITAWLLLQVIDVVAPMLEVPDWVPKSILLLLGVGFPVALLFAWAFELTPEGLKFERDVDRSTSVTHSTGRKLDFAIIGVLTVALLLFALDKFVWSVQPVEPAEEKRSIAVLPFENMSADPEQLYFSDGISEEILNSLVRVPGISVASRTSSFNYRGGNLNIPRIADELGVLFVLEGSIRKSGDELRITAQLIDAAADRHLWSETYDRQLQDIFDIQSDIANRIARSIQSELGLQLTDEVAFKALTENMSAYELYLKGFAAFNQRVLLEDVFESIAYLEQAVELDPNFAVAWQYLAAAYSVAPFYTGLAGLPADLDKYLDMGDRAADRALQLDPELAFAHAIKGGNMTLRPPFDLAGGMAQYDLALQKDPKDLTTLYWRGLTLSMGGYFAEARDIYGACLDIDPLYMNCLLQLQDMQRLLGEPHDYGPDIIERFVMSPDHVFATFLLSEGNKAAAMFAAANAPGFKGSPFMSFIEALENPDADHSDAWREFQLWADGAGIDLAGHPTIPAAFGAYDQISLRTTANTWYWSRLFKKFRASDEFKQMMRKFGYVDLWKDRGLPPVCRPLGDDDFECD